MSSSSPLTLSVVVIGRNEGPRLVACLESVNRMHWTGAKPEVIYVDSHSTDDSVSAAQRLGANVIILPPGRSTAARARNAGWRAAAGVLILFLDGDTELAPDFCLTACHEFMRGEAVAVFGNRREIRPRASIYQRALDYDWVTPAGSAAYCGGDVIIRRAALVAVNGYREDLIAGEEPELCVRFRQVGGVILHLDCAMTKHDLAIHRWAQYWKRAVRTGYAYAEVSRLSAASCYRLWHREASTNLVQGSLYMGLLATPLFAALWSAMLPAFLGLMLLIAMLVGRTYIRCATRVPDPGDRFVYAVHSHVQQVPICWGQLNYWHRRWTGQRQSIIEYK